MLVSNGVQPVDAQRLVTSLAKGTSINGEPTGFFELYGQGGLSKAAKRFKGLNVRGLEVLDLRSARPDGVNWDFTRQSDRLWALRLLREQQPMWVIASPPCTPFSVLNQNCNFGKMDPADVQAKIDEGMVHLRFVCKVYQYQIRNNRYFLHEHPRLAKSWSTSPVQNILKHDSVYVTKCDQCQYGAVSHTDSGGVAPILKPTKFMSNSLPMLKRLSKVCKGGHKHQPLLAGRAAAAAFYPLPLLRAILQGVADTTKADQSVASMLLEEYDTQLLMSISPVTSPDAPDSSKHEPGTMPCEGGGKVRIQYSPTDFKATYLDEYTREPLPSNLVQAAIKEELEYFNSRVWELSDARKVLGDGESKVIRTRWVICNKGDAGRPDIRARLVACELNTFKSDDFFASTPPLEAKRLLFSQLASQRFHPDGRPLEV